MKAKPILFSTPMVQALLEGKKTQTRRIAKVQFTFKDGTECINVYDQNNKPVAPLSYKTMNEQPELANEFCPYGNIGYLLWVKETFGWHDIFKEYVYKATDEPDRMKKWKPSIFMPKCASRITLEITNIKVERLNSISANDANAEGVILTDEYNSFTIGYANLWKQINGKDSWYSNPWVWVIEFKVHKSNFQQLIKE